MFWRLTKQDFNIRLFSWQAFPSLPPLAPLAFPSRQNFLSLPFQTPTTQAVARLCFKRRATAVLKSNLIRAIVQTLIFYHARSTDFEEKTRGSVKSLSCYGDDSTCLPLLAFAEHWPDATPMNLFICWQAIEIYAQLRIIFILIRCVFLSPVRRYL